MEEELEEGQVSDQPTETAEAGPWDDYKPWEDYGAAPPAEAPVAEAGPWDDYKPWEEYGEEGHGGHEAADPNKLTAGVREYAHGLAPAIAGFAAAGQGARLGAMLGLPLAPYTAGWSVPVGGVLGGVGGFVGGGLALSAIQEKAAKLFGMDDSETRRANAEEYPMSTWAGGTAAALSGMSPGAAVAVWARLISAGALVALEGATQYLTEGKLDPKKLFAAAAAGAVFYAPNRVGQKLLDTGEHVANKMFPGAAARLDAATGSPTTATPTPATGAPGAAQAHVDVGDTAHAPEAAEQGDLFAPKQSTVGNPQSAPVRDAGNDGRYKKGAENKTPGENAPTQGEIAPDTTAALEEWLNEGDAPPAPKPLTAADSGMLNPGEDLPIKTGFPETPEERLEKKHPHVEDVVDAAKQPGIQQPVGEGEEAHVVPGHAPIPASTDVRKRVSPERWGEIQGDQIAGFDTMMGGRVRLLDGTEMPVTNGNGIWYGKEGNLLDPRAIKEFSNDGKDWYPVKREAPKPEVIGGGQADFDARTPTPKPSSRGIKYKTPDEPRVIVGEPHPDPSAAQVKANNYKKARTRFAGKEIAIETAEGGTRTSKDPNNPWEVKNLPYNYGDVKGVKGADKDDLDIAIGKGDKHFVIDQRDPTTGKFDEHKMFTDWKSEADALTGYRRGFSDGKGRDRMMHITQVTEDEAKHWFDNGDKSVPFRQAGRGTPGRPLKDNKPGLVTATVSELRARGMDDVASVIERLPPEAQKIAAAQADASMKNRTGKIPTAESAERQATKRQGVRSKPPMVEGANVTANTIPDAIRKTNALKAADKIFQDYKVDPKRNSPETDAETIARAKAAAQASRTIGTYPFQMTKKTDAASWLKAARELGTRPNEKKLKEFRANEILARNKSGDLVQETSGIKAGIELNRNAGDERVGAADAEHAKRWEDIPHEEAQDVAPEKKITSDTELEATKLPRKTIDMTSAEGRKELAKQMAGKKPAAAIDEPERFITLKDGTKVKADKAQGEVRKPTVSDELKKKYAEQINAPKEIKSGTAIDMYAKYLKDEVKALKDDNSGALNIQKIKDDWKKLWTQPKAKSWRARTPKGHAEEYAASLDHKFQVLKQEDIDHKGRMMKWADDLPKELNNSTTLEKLYYAREENRWGPNSVTPEEKALFDKHIKPLLDENDRIFDNLKKIAPGEVGRDVQDHMYRIVKGDDAEYNIMESGGGASDPIEGVNALGTKGKGPALNRTFVALERTDGKRFVIHITPEGFTFWRNGFARKVADPEFKFKTGGDYTIGKQNFKMGEATTREIEANARVGSKDSRIEYFHNAAMSAGMTNAYLGSLLRHIEYLNGLKTDPKFLALATPPGKTPRDGYIETTLKNFAGWKMDPRLAWAMNDYVQPGFNEPALNILRRISQGITKTIFWIFTAHVNNVGTHWFTGRGMDWVPFHGGYKSLFMTTGKAIKSVINQDGFQSEMRQHGAGTIYGGVLTENFTQKFGNALSEHIKENPAKWDPIARIFGWGPSTLSKAIYGVSKHIMWAVNDMMLTQAVMERMNLHGMTMEEAINSSQRHIPPYIVPSTIISGGTWGRIMSQAIQDALVFVFGRYHFGMFTSYANMVKETVHGTAHERFHAIGNMMMLGILGMLVYPKLDQAWQSLTGNKHAEAQRRGPTSIPHHLHRAWEGKADPLQSLRSTLTVSPLISTAMETLNNKDFRGKPIASPGDFRLAGHGSWKAGARVGIAEAEHAARGLISPLGTVEQGWNKKQGPLETLRDQALDIRTPSAKQAQREAQAPRLSLRESLQRYRHPPGMWEKGFNKQFGR